MKTLYQIIYECESGKCPLLDLLEVRCVDLSRRDVISTDRQALEKRCEYLNWVGAEDEKFYVVEK